MRKADINKPAVTMYPNARRSIAELKTGALKLSKNNKIADKGKLPIVKKGEFKGYVIFTLTLEERATCPRECYHWDNCYGNNMAFAHRIEHGQALEAKLEEEVKELCSTYKGVIIRLHVLGDFYSSIYALLWGKLLNLYDNLAVWGYTGHDKNSSIGHILDLIRQRYGSRFSVRFSNDLDYIFSANSTERAKPKAGKSFVCPEQTGDVANCANCALCWAATDRQVLFMTH
jgi:hypothetical protein|tara:strand:+ start:483 stop:1172 length:690 start_codon:yes stop_codon:yes gene_type:complete